MPRAQQGDTPKHRSTITFKGVIYRYDATYGQYHLVDKRTRIRVPMTIYSWGDRWEADGARGQTALAALEAWRTSLIALRAREAKEAEKHGRELRREVRQLESRASWKTAVSR